mgnify:CR=1 FL=1
MADSVSHVSFLPPILTFCGAAVVAQNLMTRNKLPDGRPQDGHRRLTCQRNAHAHECPVPGTCSVVPVENALIAWCSDQMNLTAITEGGPNLQAPRARLAQLRVVVLGDVLAIHHDAAGRGLDQPVQHAHQRRFA